MIIPEPPLDQHLDDALRNMTHGKVRIVHDTESEFSFLISRIIKVSVRVICHSLNGFGFS